MLDTFVSWSLWLQILFVLGWLGVSLFGWYILSFLSFVVNGGEVDSWTDILKCFTDDMLCHLPGGKVHRFNDIEIMMAVWDDGFFGGSKRNYSFKEIREKGLHEEVYFEMNRGHFHFWIMETVSFILGPVAVAVMIIFCIIGYFIGFVEQIRSWWTGSPTKQATS